MGDRVVGLDHLDASQLTHADAQNIFKHAGTAIKLDIVRPNASQGISCFKLSCNFYYSYTSAWTIDSRRFRNAVICCHLVLQKVDIVGTYNAQTVPVLIQATFHQFIFPQKLRNQDNVAFLKSEFLRMTTLFIVFGLTDTPWTDP